MRWIGVLILLMMIVFLLLTGCAAVKPPKVSVYDGSTFPANTIVVPKGHKVDR